MSRTLIDENVAGFALGGSGAWASASAGDQLASYNGTLHTNGTTGGTATLTPPSATTCVLILGCARLDGPTVCTITVDGAFYATWNLNTGASAGDNRFYWFRTLCAPILLAAGTSHTIVVTNTSGGTFALDGAEYYVAEAATVGRMTAGLHSWETGYPSVAGIAWSSLVATALGLTADHQGVNNEDLANGVNAAAAVNDVQTVTVDATGGTFTLTLINPQTGASYTSGALGGATTTTAATIQTTLRATNAIYNAITVTGSNGGPYTVTMLGGVGGVLVPLMAANSASLTGGTTHTATIAHTTKGQTSNPQYNTAGANTTPGWMLAEAYGTAANEGLTWPRTPALFAAICGINDFGVWNTNDTGTPAAGVGYSARRFAQRLKEIFWRIKANCPTAELWAMTQPPSLSSDVAASWSTFAAINGAIIAAATDPTVQANVCDVRTLLGVANGGASLYGSDHPNAAGHAILANAFLAAYRAKHTELYGQVATAIR